LIVPDCTDTPPTGLATEPGRKPLTARALAKQSTRAKLLQAARQLFTEQGYEGATIRDIAAAAGMSTGAVFANFTEKFDLFREIAADDMARLMEAMKEGAAAGKTVDEALLGVFAAGYSYYLEQLPLARAKLAVGWSEDEGRELRRVMPTEHFLGLITATIEDGVRRGELSGQVEIPLRAQMMWELYLANFRNVIFEDWDMDAVRARMADQIRIVLAGARATVAV
jgi:AcrR family transcriptional regulator